MDEKRDRLIVVTGASGGLGSALVDYLKTSGYENVVCQYRNHDVALREVCSKRSMNFDHSCFKADLTDEGDVTRFYDWCNYFHGKPFGLINFAGGSSNSMSWKLTKEEFTKTLDMNLLTTFLTCKAFIPGMREQSEGRIINVTSVVGFSGVAGASHYCAAKAAIAGFTKSISLELASKNVTANALGLGYFDTGLITQVPEALQQDIKQRIPLKRFGTTSEAGGAVRYLLSDEGAYSTGQVLHINGGVYNA